MALKAASSLMSYTHNGCSHSREMVEDADGNMVVVPGDWVLECGPCEVSLAGHELWGPANEPAPLTADEIRLREAQHADATRNLWSGLAAMPEQLAALAMQNQGTMAILAKMLGVDVSNGLPTLPVGMLPTGAPGAVPGQPPTIAAPAAPPAPPVQDAAPPAPTAKQTAASKAAASKAAASKAAASKAAAKKAAAAPKPRAAG